MEIFALSCKAGTAVEIRAQSSEIAAHLTLYAPDGTLLAKDHLADSETTTTRIQTLLAHAGSYLLVVSGGEAEQFGRFDLSVRALEYREPGPLSIPGESIGLLHARDEALIARNTFVDRHVLKVDQAVTIVAEMRSEVVDAYLFLTDARGGVILGENDDAHPGTTDARLVVELQPGSYQLLATTYASETQGLYELSVRSLELVYGGDLPVPAEVAGRLRGTDPIRPPRGSHYHSFDLTIDRQETVIIDMTSADVDTFLYLYEGDGETLLEENDDRPGGGTDSRITKELGPGKYRLVATTYRAGEAGVYELQIRSVSLDSDAKLTVPSRTNWFLGGRQSQPRGPRGTLQDRHLLEIASSRTIRIDMKAESFDAYLILLAGDGTTVLAENDDAGPQSTDARLIVHLGPGRYHLAATSFHPGGEGLYELELSEVDPSTPGAIPVGPP